MIDQYRIETEARLAMLEYFVAYLHKVVFEMLRLSPEDVQFTLKGLREQTRKQVFQGLDAAQSDLLAAELENASERVLRMIEEMRAEMGKPRQP